MHENRCTVTVNDDGVAHLRLTRVAGRNAIDRTMVEAIAHATDSIEADDRIRSLLITGDGPSFCVGGDLKYFTDNLDTLADEFDTMVSLWHRTLPRLAELPYAVVTAIHGGTAGGGLGLVWCADHVIAGESTKIATGFSDLGLSGDGGSSWHLPRLVGMRRAQEMILENRVLDATTALEWNLVNRVVPDAELVDTALERARWFATRSITATREGKRLLAAATSSTHREQLAAEHQAMLVCGSAQDAQAGIRAFIERKAPTFLDR
ncbi:MULTISPECIES: enoyl-CoA hydratase/isomerase family protein [Rhodococcus]|uniref:enoyl-CoA hydratase/isomerase family protein n=1 Tax=Rhodococcus TaxID=1827 RepID=UPI000832B34D|nr:enoyl-CoA hydratase-related protein [Rhodococcus phenolicus]